MRDIERSRRGEVHTAIPVVPGAAQVALLTLVLIGLWTAAAWPFEPRVMQAQQKLMLLGFNPGAADGLLGPRTHKALQEFQQAHTLPRTGKLDPPTLQALGLLTPADHSANCSSAVVLEPEATVHTMFLYRKTKSIGGGRLAMLEAAA